MRVKMLMSKSVIGRNVYHKGDIFEMDARVAPAFITTHIVEQVSDNTKLRSTALEKATADRKAEAQKIVDAKLAQQEQDKREAAEKLALAKEQSEDTKLADKPKPEKVKTEKKADDKDADKGKPSDQSSGTPK